MHKHEKPERDNPQMKRKLGIEEIHSITLELMDQFHIICEKNGLKYYLNYGTLIGAIRHKGFIPWDDDFDIMMEREDYNKLLSLLEKETTGRYRLITRGNTPNYYNGIARFCDTKYEYITELDVKQYQQGIFIDVYPLDSCADTEEEADIIHKKIQKLNAKYIIYCNRKSLTSKINTIIRTPYYAYLHLRYGKHFGQKIEEMTKKIIYSHLDRQTKNVCIYWESRDFRLIPRKWLQERELWPFEDRQYWITKEYDAFLRLHYGDYMQLPPESERIATHNYSVYEKDA